MERLCQMARVLEAGIRMGCDPVVSIDGSGVTVAGTACPWLQSCISYSPQAGVVTVAGDAGISASMPALSFDTRATALAMVLDVGADEAGDGGKFTNNALAVLEMKGIGEAARPTVLVLLRPSGERLSEVVHSLGMGWTVSVWRRVWAVLLLGASRRPWGVAHVYRPRHDPPICIVLPSRDTLLVPAVGFRLLVGGSRTTLPGVASLHVRAAEACLRTRGLPVSVARFLLDVQTMRCPTCCLQHAFLAPLRTPPRHRSHGERVTCVDLAPCNCE
jgi:hypothetical protein